jgi:hypothetical protein
MADFTLPHPLILTGVGFDPGEFFEGCQADAGITPFGGTNAHGFGIGESLLSYGFNRPPYAIMEDVEYLKDALNDSVQRRSFVVCAETAASFADFEGPDSLMAAIAFLGASGGTIFVRRGDYEPTVNITVPSYITIIGDSDGGANLNLGASAVDLLVSGDHVSIRGLHIDLNPGNSLTWTGDHGVLEECRVHLGSIYLNGAVGMSVREIDMPDVQSSFIVKDCTELSVENVRLTQSAASVVKGLVFSNSGVNRGVSFRGCSFITDGGTPLSAGDGAALHIGTATTVEGSFSGCVFFSKCQAVYTAANSVIQASFEGCHFRMIAGILASARDEFVSFQPVGASKVVLNGCVIDTDGGDWTTRHNGFGFIQLYNVSGKGLKISASSMVGGNAAPDDKNFITFSGGSLEEVYIDVAAEASAGAGADGILSIGSGGIVKGLVWATVTGAHTIPLVYLEGTLHHPAMLDRAFFTGSASFYNTTTACLVGTDNYSVTRKVEWTSSVDPAHVNLMVVGIIAPVLRDVVIEECDLLNSSGTTQQWLYVIRASGEGKNVRIEKNRINWTVKAGTALFAAILVDGINVISNTNVDFGFQFGSVSHNTIELAWTNGDGFGLPTVTHIVLEARAFLTRVDHNICSTAGMLANTGANKFIYIQSNNIGAVPGNSGGNTTYGNILIDKTNPLTLPPPGILLGGGNTPGYTDTMCVQLDS